MTDKLLHLLSEHFDAILYTVIGVVLIVLGLMVKLFHELRTDPENTKRALWLEVSFIRNLRDALRKDAPKKKGRDPLAETITPQDKP